MKKILIIIGLLISTFALGQLQGANNLIGHIYPKSGIIIEVNQAQDLITIEDSVGMLWAYEGIEDLEEGDKVAMVMEDNGTESVYDDSIIDIIYQCK